MRITDDNLHGRVVLTADGIAIGEVTKLFLQGERFALDGIEVKLRKEAADRLRLKRSTFHSPTIEIPPQFVQSVGDAVLLSAMFDDLHGIGAPNGVTDEPVDTAPVTRA